MGLRAVSTPPASTDSPMTWRRRPFWKRRGSFRPLPMIVSRRESAALRLRREQSFHERAKAWCEEVMSGPSPLTLAAVVVFGFIRIAPSPGVQGSLSISEAADHVRSWLAMRHVRLHEMLPETWPGPGAAGSGGTAGNLTSDARSPQWRCASTPKSTRRSRFRSISEGALSNPLR